MKRDQSLIFTAVPEEGSEQIIEPSERTFVPTSKKNRPKFLNLKSISIDENVEVKTVKSKVGTPFCGQTSVCSTPMTELKKFVHQNPLSICRNKDELANDEIPLKTINRIPKNTNEILRNSKTYKPLLLNNVDKKKYGSLVDLSEIINSISKDSSQYFNIRNKTFAKIDLSPKKSKNDRRCKTITDPTFPVFKSNGCSVSMPYYYYYINRDVAMVEKELENENNDKAFINFDSCPNSKTAKAVPNNVAKSENEDLPKKAVKYNREHRKSLTLPLKSLSTELESVTETAVSRRYSSGVQLTPLLSKLSILAFEEKSSGFGSRDQTPCDYRGLTPTQTNFSFPYNKYKQKEMNKIEDDGVSHKCTLFVCGQQDIVLTILLTECGSQDQQAIKRLVS